MPVDFKLKDFLYPVSLIRMHRFLKQSQWYSPAQLREYQSRRLRSVVRTAYRDIPYYRDLFDTLGIRPEDIRSPDDLHHLPLLTKEILRKNFDRMISPHAKRLHAKRYTTSGSTGQPVAFLLDKPANVLEFCYYWRHWSWGGYRLGKRFAELTNGFFLKNPDHRTDIYRFSRITNRLQLNTLMVNPDHIGTFADALRRYKVRYLNGLASALYYFAIMCRRKGIDDISFDAIFSQGEMLYPAYRSLIEDVFRCKVFDSYGHMERTVAVCECPHGGYHVNSEYGILEIIDQKPAENGRMLGTAVGTSLHSAAMPLIRYVINDRVEFEPESRHCACGRGLPLIGKIHGRNDDVIVTPDGTVVTDIFTVFGEIPGIDLGQIEQMSLSEIQVLIAVNEQWNPECERRFINLLRAYLGSDVRIDVRQTKIEKLRAAYPGKFKVVVSHIQNRVTGE